MNNDLWDMKFSMDELCRLAAPSHSSPGNGLKLGLASASSVFSVGPAADRFDPDGPTQAAYASHSAGSLGAAVAGTRQGGVAEIVQTSEWGSDIPDCFVECHFRRVLVRIREINFPISQIPAAKTLEGRGRFHR